VLPDPPASSMLAEVRRVLDGLLGECSPPRWDDVRHIRVGTGRLPMNADERAGLGELADRFRLFG
jgi:hypothetical protein